MKILHKRVAKDGEGVVKLLPEETEDLWYTYNLILEGDRLAATTVRKVQKETAAGTNKSERMRLALEVVVEATEYDAVASVLRVRGKNVAENEHVKLGAYHTIEIELQRAFTITKDSWDAIALEVLQQASDPAATAEVAAVMMQEGLANICLVTGSITTVRSRIESPIPKKRGPAVAGYDKALNKFFKTVYQAVLRHVNFDILKCLIIASPGSLKDQFHEYLLLEATRQNCRPIIESKNRIILAPASCGYKHGLKEVFAAPAVAAQIKDTKAAREAKALENFHAMMTADPSRAFYGPAHVEAAHEELAIQTLLIIDELFRNVDIPTRRKYVDLVESVKQYGGEALVFSSMHVSGEQLKQLTGIAATLRFPLPHLEDLEPEIVA